jgi:hypothetical protein
VCVGEYITGVAHPDYMYMSNQFGTASQPSDHHTRVLQHHCVHLQAHAEEVSRLQQRVSSLEDEASGLREALAGVEGDRERLRTQLTRLKQQMIKEQVRERRHAWGWGWGTVGPDGGLQTLPSKHSSSLSKRLYVVHILCGALPRQQASGSSQLGRHTHCIVCAGG